MGIGTSVVLLAAGAILYWAVEVNLPFVDDNALGAILMVGGAIAATVTVILNARRSQTGVGTGVALIVAGAVVYVAIDVDLPFVFDGALGLILMAAGVIAILATVTMASGRSRATHVVDDRRHDR
jgi:uncharacterized membrane protein YccC